MKKLISEYRRKKSQIKKRLKEFNSLCKAGDKDIFSELCFCILTPQTKAVSCDEAVKDLKKSGLLLKGNTGEISKRLKGTVRFHNNKAAYLVAARKFFSAQGSAKGGPASGRGSLPVRQAGASGGKNGKGLDVKSKLTAGDILGTRNWLVRNVKGLGYKEASHFLRNIGLGKNIAIIDRHILENLKRYGVIKKIPALVGKKTYIGIEDKMRRFSRRLGIPMEELDLLLWSDRTGFIFK